MGIPQHTQVDNEGCCSGGFAPPGVSDMVLHLALYVGAKLVFSPGRHPQSNGSVERFQQDHGQHVGEDTELQDYAGMQEQGDRFFVYYRRSRHHSALGGRSSAAVHSSGSGHRLSSPSALATGRLPLKEGHVRFVRRVSDECTIKTLNLTWSVSDAEPGQAVWATLEFTPMEPHWESTIKRQTLMTVDV